MGIERCPKSGMDDYEGCSNWQEEDQLIGLDGIRRALDYRAIALRLDLLLFTNGGGG